LALLSDKLIFFIGAGEEEVSIKTLGEFNVFEKLTQLTNLTNFTGNMLVNDRCLREDLRLIICHNNRHDLYHQ
jgi:hypothetical protein